MVNDISKLQANGQVKQEFDVKIAEKKQTGVKNVNTEKQDAAPKIENESKEQEKVKSSVYGNVIGASRDGDTVSAKKQAMEALNTGMVFKKSPAAEMAESSAKEKADAVEAPAKEIADVKEAPAKAVADAQENPAKEAIKEAQKEEKAPVEKAQEAEEKKEKKETSELEIATDDQLDAMFEQGKISKIKYDEENERREIIRGEDDKEEKKSFLIEENEDEQKKEETADVKKEIKAEDKKFADVKAQDEKVSKNKSDNKAIIRDETDKLEAEKETSKAKDTKAEESRKENREGNTPDSSKRTFDIEEEVKDDKAFAEEMGKMVAKENDEKIRSDAMEEAVKSGRDELMTQIFGTGLE